MRSRYWSSDVCASDRPRRDRARDTIEPDFEKIIDVLARAARQPVAQRRVDDPRLVAAAPNDQRVECIAEVAVDVEILPDLHRLQPRQQVLRLRLVERVTAHQRSEEPTSEIQSLMRISYAVFCLKK